MPRWPYVADFPAGRPVLPLRRCLQSGPSESRLSIVNHRQSKPKIFVGYRRTDGAAHAGRLADALIERLGADNVFHDVAAITPGADFTLAIDAALTASDISLVVIGPRWLSAADERGSRRLDDPDDFVHREVAASLAKDVIVIPVLIGGASLPTAGELPAELSALALRQAVELRDEGWHADVQRLLDQLDPPAPQPATARSGWIIAAAVGLATVAIAATVWIARNGDSSSDDSGPLGPCGGVEAVWTEFDIQDDTEAEVEKVDELLLFTVEQAHFQSTDPGRANIALHVRVENLLPPDTDDEKAWFDANTFGDLFVDGVSQGEATCFNLTEGRQDLGPEQSAVGVIGFADVAMPTGTELILDTDGPPVSVRIAG